MRLSKSVHFEAAHRNPRGTPRQQQLHGHSYILAIHAEGTVDAATGWIVDFAEMKRWVAPVVQRLDHTYLGDIPGLQDDATLPSLKRWILSELGVPPAWFAGITLRIRGDLTFNPRTLPADPQEELPARVGFTFEAAQSLPHLHEGHPCRAVHGHSYTLEIGTEHVDESIPVLRRLYEELDHTYLNDLPNLPTATCENLAVWINDRLIRYGLRPSVVVVQETPTARCIYRP
jgi:6-pyruvoyltetrahydropterin/6-carboxytetrahydropterin synthase